MNTKIDELFATMRGLISDQSRDLALAMAELASVAAERDKWKTAHKIACDGWDHAAKSLRAAEQDLAETESVNSDLRTVNARLMADLAAAMEWAARTPRLNHAESILMQ